MGERATGFFGWRVVAAAFVVAVFGWGLGFYGPPVYLEAVRQARGWPVTLVSGAVTVHFLVGVVVIANLPALHRRFGLPQVTLAGAVVLALGVAGWATAQAPWQLYAATFLSGAGWPALGAAALNAIVAPWFVRKRPAALSMAYNGASIGGVIFSPLWVALIGWFGFPLAAALVGAVMVGMIAVLAACVLARTPEGMGQVPDGEAAGPAGGTAPSEAHGPAPVASLSRDRAFLTLAAGMALALFAQIGLLAHLVSMLVPALGIQGAGLAAGLATAAAILGRSLVGIFMPPGADRRLVACASLLVQALGCGALLAADAFGLPLLLAGVVLIGLGIGNATSLPPLVAQAEFAKADVARVVAFIVAGAQATYAFAPAAFGLLRATAPEGAVYVAAALVQFAAVAAYMSGRNASGGRVSLTSALP
ncbi:MAG TPA: MFS transporter [Microvirga sp.]|jgi:MFS family permease|nr:MFS transporter [Microvirga sp.]